MSANDEQWRWCVEMRISNARTSIHLLRRLVINIMLAYESVFARRHTLHKITSTVRDFIAVAAPMCKGCPEREIDILVLATRRNATDSMRWDEYRSLDWEHPSMGPWDKGTSFLLSNFTVRWFSCWLEDGGELRILWLFRWGRRIAITFMMIGITELKQFHETAVQTLNIRAVQMCFSTCRGAAPRNVWNSLSKSAIPNYWPLLSIKRVANTFKMQMRIIRNLFAMFDAISAHCERPATDGQHF